MKLIYGLIFLILPIKALGVCILNKSNAMIDFWYYSKNSNHSICIEKKVIDVGNKYCYVDNIKSHFINEIGCKNWYQFEFQTQDDDILEYKNHKLIVNSLKKYEGHILSKNLNNLKSIKFCNQVMNDDFFKNKECHNTVSSYKLKIKTAVYILDYMDSLYNLKQIKKYSEISIEGKNIDLSKELQGYEYNKLGAKYTFKDYLKCNEYIKVTYKIKSSPKASKEVIFILKYTNNILEIIDEKISWVS